MYRSLNSFICCFLTATLCYLRRFFFNLIFVVEDYLNAVEVAHIHSHFLAVAGSRSGLGDSLLR